MEIRKIAKTVVGSIVGLSTSYTASKILETAVPEVAGKARNLEVKIGVWAIGGVAAYFGKKYAEDVFDAWLDVYDALSSAYREMKEAFGEDDDLKAKIDEKAEEIKKAIEDFDAAGKEAVDGGASDAGEDVPAAE